MRTPIVLTTVPDRRRHLSSGGLVEATIRARLLGLPLLAIDAAVVLTPADVGGPPSAEGLPARRSILPARNGRLAEAVREIGEGAELLAEARLGGAERDR